MVLKFVKNKNRARSILKSSCNEEKRINFLANFFHSFYKRKSLLFKILIFIFAARIFKRKAMGNLKDYVISFRGLKIGDHEFDFQITDSFFEAFEYSRTQKGKIALKVILNKAENMLKLDFFFKGSVNVICDSCGEDFDFPLDFSENLLVKFSDYEEEDSANIIFLPSSTYEIKLAQLIYEYVNLALPMRLTHPEDEDGNPVCPVDILGEFEDLTEPEDDVDPRWEALKKLKSK